MKYILIAVLFTGCTGPRAHYCPLMSCSLGQQLDIRGPLVEDKTKDDQTDK